jgi:hypothetical protein
MLLETGQVINQLKIDGEVTDIIEMNNVSLPDMDCDLVPGYMVEGKTIFPFWLEAEKINK